MAALPLSSQAIAGQTEQDKRICKKLLESEELSYRDVFYSDRKGQPKVLEESGGRPSDMTGKFLYYVRNNVKAPGGVLIVKAAHGSGVKKNRRVKLRRGTFSGKAVVEDCEQEPEVSDFGKKRKKRGSQSGDHELVGYNVYQLFANARPDIDRTKLKNPDDLDAIGKRWHFRFKNRARPGKRNSKCHSTSDTFGNRFQSSLRLSDTGSRDWVAQIWRGIRNFKETSEEAKARQSNWDVTLLPYDANGSGRSCFRINVPNLEKAKLVRINDLETRDLGKFLKDREFLRGSSD